MLRPPSANGEQNALLLRRLDCAVSCAFRDPCQDGFGINERAALTRTAATEILAIVQSLGEEAITRLATISLWKRLDRHGIVCPARLVHRR